MENAAIRENDMDVKQIGVVGAGTMGAGIAQVAAQTGYSVILSDLKQEFLDKGLAVIKKSLDKLDLKGQLNSTPAEVMGRLTTIIGNKELANVDMIFEVITENMEIKQKLFAELDELCKPETIICSNTSGLSITNIASATHRSDKVVGTHFFYPVPLMKLVELVKGSNTSEETYQTALEVCTNFGKSAINVKEAPLFAVNRILMPMINEAIFVLQEGIATAEDIDKGMILGVSHPIGPLALADVIGLDVLLMVMDTLYKETQDSKYRVCSLLRRMVRAGHYGRKTGRGFYEYK
jgi:3-hydroxybutyryl-CoA dehydrogenase